MKGTASRVRADDPIADLDLQGQSHKQTRVGRSPWRGFLKVRRNHFHNLLPGHPGHVWGGREGDDDDVAFQEGVDQLASAPCTYDQTRCGGSETIIRRI
jgi:hypothetical protein